MRTLVSVALIGVLLAALAGCAATSDRNSPSAAAIDRPESKASPAGSPWARRIQAP